MSGGCSFSFNWPIWFGLANILLLACNFCYAYYLYRKTLTNSIICDEKLESSKSTSKFEDILLGETAIQIPPRSTSRFSAHTENSMPASLRRDSILSDTAPINETPQESNLMKMMKNQI